MNDEKEREDNILSSNDGNKGLNSSSVGGGSGGSNSQPFPSMGPNRQYGQHNQQDCLTTKIGLSVNNTNCHSNGGGNHLNNSNSANANNNGSSSSSSSSSSVPSNNNNSNGSNNFSSEVCRDFLRNVCRRGVNCRYRHPEGSEAEELGKKVDLIFCHDYQNKECRRSNCRFIHCTKQEEEIYKATGKLPAHLIEKLSYSRLNSSLSSPSSFHHHSHQQNIKSVLCDNINNGLSSSITSNLASSYVSSLASSFSSSLTSSSPVASSSTVASPFSTSIPVCKDNLKGDCLRGMRCKFRHISQIEYDLESRSASTLHSIGGGVRSSSMERNNTYHQHSSNTNTQGNSIEGPTSYQGGLAPPEPKRRAYDTSLGFGPPPSFTHRSVSSSSFNHPGLSSIQSSNDFDSSKIPPSSHSQTLFNNNRFLEDENFTLRRQIEDLKKQVADLMASNEILMEQNAQLRTMGNISNTPSLPPSIHHINATTIPNDPFIGSRSNDNNFHQHQHHVSVSFPQTIGVGGIPVSSMAALSTNVMSNSNNPLVSYPLMTTAIQSLRPPTIPHSLGH